MPSPFPGMDPYLEDPGGWAGAHDALIAIMRELLNRQLGPEFIADGGTSVSVLTPDERRWMYPDIIIIGTPTAPAIPSRRGAIVAPLRVSIAAPLLPGHDDIPLDLQTALDLLFGRYRYAELLDPGTPPPAPPFPPAGVRWIAAQVQQRQATRATGAHEG